MTPETITAMDTLTQIESRLEAALNDIETVLHYIRQITHKEDTHEQRAGNQTV